MVVPPLPDHPSRRSGLQPLLGSSRVVTLADCCGGTDLPGAGCRALRGDRGEGSFR
uniref:Uncharacterized protein n=1 Tax=Arundo donax TaxID=35708 RepID=A0A0A9C5U8_ARUDO